jgi:transposase InsO family protein
VGRPPLDLELRTLIRRMTRENPTWGRRRIQAELRFLGYEIAELTVAKYMRRPSPRPSSTWRTFLGAYTGEIVAIDFFVVPTLTFHLLFGFLILRHARRELVHINVTDHPTAAWAAHQLVESFPEETAPRYLLRDRDAIYGDVFVRRVNGLGMTEVLIAPRAPWQNPFAERVIGSIRRECLDHVIVLNERHLRRLLRRYFAYYNATRPHQALHNAAPIGAKCKRQPAGASLRFRRSADFITAISAPPECAIQQLHARWSRGRLASIRRASVFLTQRLSLGPPRRSRVAYTLTRGQARLPRSANQVCDRNRCGGCSPCRCILAIGSC